MAYGIPNLRQQQLFDQYGMLSLPDLMGDTPPYQQNYGQMDTPNVSFDPNRPPAPTETGNPFSIGSDIEMGPNVQFGPPAPLQTPRTMIPQTQEAADPNSKFKQLWDMVNQVYTPETRASDRFNTLLDEFPERNQPGWARKLAASMVAGGDPSKGGGIAGAENVLYAPYMRDVSAWKEKTGPFSQAAQQENTGNVNERTLAGNMVTAQTNADRIAEQGRQADERNRITEDKNKATADIARQKNEIAWAKANGAKFETKGASVIALFPDGTAVDTGVPTTAYSPFELESLRQANRMALEGARTAGDIAIKQTVPGANPATVKPPTPPSAANQDKALQLKFQELIATDPTAAKWIEQGDDGKFRLKQQPVPSGGGAFGIGSVPQSELDEWNSVARKVYPDAVPPPAQIPSSAPAGKYNIPTTGGSNQSVIPGSTLPTPSGTPSPTPAGRLTPERLTPEQQQEAVRSGTRLELVDRRTGKVVGTIPATEEEMRFYINHPTVRVRTPGQG